MYATQAPYRALCEQVLDHEPPSVLTDLLLRWIAHNPDELAWLRAFATRPGSPIPPASNEDLCRLYALSRVSDLLLTLHPRSPDGGMHAAFLTALGLTRIPAGPFTPLLHEIVDVQPTPDPTSPIEIVSERWPGFTLGPLVFARAGCVVSGGAEHIDPAVALRSTMYWTHRRPSRPTTDLSAGWGSNSQWRTAFRRDYTLDGHGYYNVDADGSRSLLEDGLTEAEALELVRHRCFIRCTKADDDLWPYDMGWVEPVGWAPQAAETV